MAGFGALLVVWPAISLHVLVLLFGAFALADGALIVTAAAMADRDAPDRGVALLGGALAVAAGVVTFLWPGLTELTVLILIAIRALIIGSAELLSAIYVARHVPDGGLATSFLAVMALLSIAFGAVLLIFPGAGLLALVWVTGLYAIALGLLQLVRAWLVTIMTVQA